jgi:hypothetical protein
MRIAREHEFPRRARLPSGEEKSRSTARQRPSAAFVASIAILLTGTLLLAGGLAWARNAEIVWPPWDPAPEIAPIPDVDVQTAPIPRETRAAGRAVCVRLCDGFFFPSATSSGGDEACAAQCPDAPTARYTEPAGSDRIEDAVSTRGALYAALPVANRYQTTLDNMCACRHARAGGYSESLLNDPTLRKGDVVMTPKGFVVFQGAKTRSIRSSDFVALSQARSLPKELRAVLVDMERAGPSQRQVGDESPLIAPARHSEGLTPLASAVSAK